MMQIAEPNIGDVLWDWYLLFINNKINLTLLKSK